ncbi:MAG: response regulator [Rhizobiales bacterium]|nr:response regulator [Hyphomicrobiales bacterium]
MIGKTLVRFGTGTLSARHVAGQDQGENRVEVSYTPPLGANRSILFKPQNWVDGDFEYMILIGQHASVEQAELAVQNERRLNLALRSGGYAVWDHDFRGNVTYNSPEMHDLLGIGRESPGIDYHQFNEMIHPDDRDKTLDGMIRTAPFGSDLFQTRYRVQTQTGSYVWVESIAGVIRDPIDAPAKCVGLCRNVNDQMLALERLRNSERSLKRTQEAAQLGSFSLRVESGVSRLSAEMAALIGMADAVIHPNLPVFEQMIEPGDKEKFSEALELAKLGQPILALEIAVRLRSGDLEYFSCTIEGERSAAGRVETLFGSCQRITERKGLERKFLQAQKMEAVGQLTGGVAHDFNNLLMVVMGNLQLVEQLVKTDERASKRIRAAIDAAEKGSELTKRMLAFSRQQTLQNKELDANSLIVRMQDMLMHAVSANVELKIMPAEGLWPIKADPTMLETAILNLSINARDAMKPKGGHLTIETSNRHLGPELLADHEDAVAGDYIEIAVTDTGCGIAKENIEKVFQPFFTTKGPEAGSGLGLSMIYGFVKQSGGLIKIYSEVGHGTTVKLYLPRGKAAVDALSPPGAPDELRGQIERELSDTSGNGGKKPIILVVEDNAQVREVAAAMIEEMGYETLLASNGPEGLALVEERSDIDLVITDVIMAGGMNGPEMAAKARAIRPELKLLFMSGYAPGSVRQMQDLPESVELVNKPFTRTDLTDKVRRALAA